MHAANWLCVCWGAHVFVLEREGIQLTTMDETPLMTGCTIRPGFVLDSLWHALRSRCYAETFIVSAMAVAFRIGERDADRQ